MKTELLTESLIPVAAELVATVRDYGPDDVAAILSRVPEGQHHELAVVLAAMVDPDATPSQLLAWTTAGPVKSRQFTPSWRTRRGTRSGMTAEATNHRDELRAEILRLTRDGLTRPQIAARLGINVRSVERHRAALRQEMENVS